MSHPRIYADFQNLDDLNRLRLNRAGTLRDLHQQGIALQPGLALTLYTDDEDENGRPLELQADAIVEFDAETQSWAARLDWKQLRHSPQKNVRVVPANGSLSSNADELTRR